MKSKINRSKINSKNQHVDQNIKNLDLWIKESKDCWRDQKLDQRIKSENFNQKLS